MHQYGPFLVIVPLSTITAWQMQFRLWAPDINVITYIGTANAREVIRKHEFGSSNKKLKLNVLLTTYELTLRDAKELGDIKWQSLAVDEVNNSLVTCEKWIDAHTGPSLEKLREPVVRSTAYLPCSIKTTHYWNPFAK